MAVNNDQILFAAYICEL